MVQPEMTMEWSLTFLVEIIATASGLFPTLIEPWKCFVHWRQKIPGQHLSVALTEFWLSIQRYTIGELAITFHNNVLDINITSILLSLYSTDRVDWTEDYVNSKADITWSENW